MLLAGRISGIGVSKQLLNQVKFHLSEITSYIVDKITKNRMYLISYALYVEKDE
jgi:hypothetical protein